MRDKSKRLGKGLEAIFMENSILDEKPSDTLEINMLQPNKNQPRKVFDEEALMGLADSISQHGLLQPLLVRPLANGNYQIIAGERRWRACRMAGITEVPVIIRDFTDIEVMEVALIENLQRENLSPVEEAKAYSVLIEECGLTQEQVSKSVGKSRPYITNSLRLLNLPEKVMEFLDKKRISAGHARTLLSLQDENDILKVLDIVVEKGLSVRDLERLVKSMNESTTDTEEQTKKSGTSKQRNVFFTEVELLLSENLGRKVTVNESSKNDGGMLQIQFYSSEDLADIAKKLGR